MNVNDAIAQFAAGSLSLDLPRTTISSESTDVAFEGPAIVWQNKEGLLELKLFVTRFSTNPINTFSAMNEYPRSGELFLDEHYFKCTLVDLYAHQWTIPHTIIKQTWSFSTNQGIITSRPAYIEVADYWHANVYTMQMIFFRQQIRDWVTLSNTFTLTVTGIDRKFECLSKSIGSDQILFEIHADGSFPEGFETRILEALQFALGTTLRIGVLDKIQGRTRIVRLYTARGDTSKEQAYPPIETRSRRFEKETITLLNRYLNAFDNTEMPEMWHPCSRYLAHMRQASANSLDAWAVGITVATEGIAQLVDYSNPIDKRLGMVLNVIRRWMKRRQFDQNIQDRVNGCLGGLSITRAVDKMYFLEGAGSALKQDIKAWKDLRDRSVYTVVLEELGSADIQDMLNKVHSVYCLANCMIFHLIGYKGAYSNYARPNFPVDEYPFSRVL
jgi:hypothetical protein